jgi:predicted dehydrogenase
VAEDKTFKVGVLGTGWVAGAHIDTFSKIDGCEVVAVSSRDKQRAADRIAELGISAEPYDNVDALLGHDGLDIVVICTPHPNHPAETIAAANAGKHIVIEKPVSLNREDLAKMVKAVNAAGVQTSVCFELHWNGMFAAMKKHIEAGKLGKLFYGEASYFHGIGPWYGQWNWNTKKAMGGDALLTAGCHALDALIWLMDSPVVEVSAMSNTSPDNPLEYEYDTNSIAILKFANGALGKVATSIESRHPYLFPVLVQGDKGALWNNQIATVESEGAMSSGWSQFEGALPDSGDVNDHPYAGQLQYFVDCIRNGERPHNDLAAASHVHEVIFAINKSIATGQVAAVPKTPWT